MVAAAMEVAAMVAAMAVVMAVVMVVARGFCCALPQGRALHHIRVTTTRGRRSGSRHPRLQALSRRHELGGQTAVGGSLGGTWGGG